MKNLTKFLSSVAMPSNQLLNPTQLHQIKGGIAGEIVVDDIIICKSIK